MQHSISLLCTLFEGSDYTVWAAVEGIRDAVMVKRHCDGSEWFFLSDSKEDNLLRDLLPEDRYDPNYVDRACDDAWNLLGPKRNPL